MKPIFLILAKKLNDFTSESEMIEFHDMISFQLYKIEDCDTLQIQLAEILQEVEDNMKYAIISEETYETLNNI